MKAVRDNRTLHLSDLPNTADGLNNLPEAFSITINYTRTEGPSVLDKALSLDHVILPLIVKALNEA